MSPTERPRVEGDREQEILDATLEVLADVGYDRLTMDAVAARAKASKATLYRRWTNKVSLVIDALQHEQGPDGRPRHREPARRPARRCSAARAVSATPHAVAMFAAVLTAIARDAEFAEAFRRDVIGPKIAASQQIWERARERGEIRDGRSTSTCSSRPSPGSSCTASSSWARHPTTS